VELSGQGTILTREPGWESALFSAPPAARGPALRPVDRRPIDRRPVDLHPIDLLSSREREVLAQLADGRSNEAAADHLHLSLRTVEAHIRSIFVKLGLEPEPGTHRRVRAVVMLLSASRGAARR
jgi:DNA-binding NarL/FixJ family response regulator